MSDRLLGGAARLSFTARIDCEISLLFTRIQRGGWCGLHCAHRATTASSWGLSEHRDHASCLATPLPSSLAYLSTGQPGGSSNARVQRDPFVSFSAPSHLLALRESPDYPSLRASDEHSFIVRVLRARRMVWLLPIPSFRACSPSLLEGGLFGLLLRASNEGLRRPRVARAQETNRLPSLFPIRRTS
jgi:hypothetical protein